MESLVEPNIHPLLVHFAIALTMTAALAYVLAWIPAASRWRASLTPAADWMLAFAALAVVATVAAGFQAYYSVAHDGPSHAAMTTHRNWAVPTGVAILALSGWRWFRRLSPPSALFTTLIVAGAVLIAVTGWWGGKLVFAHGLGVASLPQAEEAGHNHEHGAVGEHEHEAGVPTPVAAPGTPEAVVDALAVALRAGDAAAVERLMAPDVVIAESGGVERSFAEYAGHHMPADMAFTAAAQFTLEQRDVIAGDDVATVISRSQVHGEFQGRTIHSRMMETMTLRRIDGAWRIVHIHWSSAPITGEHEH